MYKCLVAVAALAATASAYGAVGSSLLPAGKARIVNGCTYDVQLANTPAAGGGFEIISKTMEPNDTYEQTFTILSNLMGWSLKVSKDDNFAHNILQFEYTFLDQGLIWFDLSEVDGNPWSNNWEITASKGDGCTPRQAAYRFATDDAYGMQSCSQDAHITVTLCSGEEQNDDAAASASSAQSAQIDSATSAAVPENNVAATPVASPTTFATAVSVAPAGVVVTEYATAVVTEVVYATEVAKREAHLHQHRRRHLHAHQ